jgi:hypothetical protein
VLFSSGRAHGGEIVEIRLVKLYFILPFLKGTCRAFLVEAGGPLAELDSRALSG